MTYTEILELIRAGYTRAEIDAMMKQPPAAPENPPQPDKGTETGDGNDGAADQNDGKQETPPPPVATETEKLLQALGMKLDKLATAIHSANVGGMENPGNRETPETIIARIINPNGNQ